ncbi:cation:proton antiporter [Candidatus Micrarchaeota archaeon]|nr:cation:proton antiporter [Candidatus Micrarchaeota archaeon]
MIPDVFFEITLIFALTILICGIIKMLKQPLIIGYIISGIIAGPFFLSLTNSIDTLSIFASMGIAFLLFLVGLNLNPKTIKEIGKISIITGVGQVLFTSILGFIICQLLGFSIIESVYISIALTFSSTIIIMKLLSDKKDLETLYGKISIGFLIVQDFIVIFILMFLTQNLEGGNIGETILYSIAKGIGIFFVLGAIAWWIIPKITNFIAKSQEYLLLFSIGWCLIISSIFHMFNFSIEAGALIAGMMLSFSPYHYEISSRVRPLRDFLIVLFFILLGSQMVFGDIFNQIPIIIILSVLILVGNPLIVIILMGWFGYTKRNGFKAGLTVAQISEFSLILITVGIKLEHLTIEILSLVTIVGIITITGSTYLILYSDKIYPYLSGFLSLFERKGKKIDEHKYQKENSYTIVLFGYNRIGFDVLKALKKINDKVLVVDYDPNIILQLYNEGIDSRYGDANDVELIQELNLHNSKMVISTIPDLETNIILLRQIKLKKKRPMFLSVATQFEDALELYKSGADYVIMPYFLGGTKVSSMIEKYKFSTKEFTKEKSEHIQYLKKRQKECKDPDLKY